MLEHMIPKMIVAIQYSSIKISLQVWGVSVPVRCETASCLISLRFSDRLLVEHLALDAFHHMDTDILQLF